MALEDRDAELYSRGQEGRYAARDRGTAAQQELIRAAQTGLSRFDAAAADRQRLIRSGAARGLAAAAPTGRMAAGGGFLGAAGQAGMDAEMAGIRQAQADEERRLGLERRVAQAQLSETQFAAEAGNEEEEFAAALAEGDADILKAINENDNWSGYDETAIKNEREAIIARIAATNPRAAQELRRRWSAGGERYKDNEEAFV